MSVIRAARSAEGRYTQIMNAALQDERLSFRARGLMAYLLSLPPGTHINSVELAQRAKEGRDAIRKALAELEEFGYLRRTARRSSKGTFRANAVLCDDPDLPLDDEPGPENPAPGNPPKRRPPAPENPASAGQATKDKDGDKETPSESAADGGEESEAQRIKRLSGFITQYVMEKYPFNNGQAIAGIARAGLRAGTDSHLLTSGILAAAENGGPITINAVKHHIKMLTGGYERQPRTVDDPGTKVHDNGLEVLW
ncbi:hypothetical protein [Streptomyces mirabilis]|uniref:hypothetical protein n=1 Tax=Streptomyces mirabilis TaxID=68239 RepID=UPI0036A5BFD5